MFRCDVVSDGMTSPEAMMFRWNRIWLEGAVAGWVVGFFDIAPVE
jgi:hypothetical protein